MKRKGKFLFFPCNKSHPLQAGFFLRSFAFILDLVFILMISLIIFVSFTEIRSLWSEKKGVISEYISAHKKGASVSLVISSEKDVENVRKRAYLKILKKRLSDEKYEMAKEMSSEEMKGAFPEEIAESQSEHKVISAEKEFNIFFEFIIGYTYFILFFRFRGQTIGKRLLRLRIKDVKENSRLGWYQSFERTHGYVASALLVGIGFWQVLWDADGKTMHDKIAGTTVIKLPSKKKDRKKKSKKAQKIHKHLSKKRLIKNK